MKKIIIFVVVWALLIVGGRIAVFRILDQKATEAFDSLHQFSTMLGMPVKITYGKVFVDLDGSIGFKGVRLRSPQTGYTKIARISYSNGNLLNLTRLLWHVRRISQAENPRERRARSEKLFSSSTLWAQQIIRIEGIDAINREIPICDADFRGQLLTGPANIEVRWAMTKDSPNVRVKLAAQLPGLADYEFMVSTPMMDFISGTAPSPTYDRSIRFEFNGGIKLPPALVTHCAEQYGGSFEDAVLFESMGVFKERGKTLSEPEIQMIAGIVRALTEPGVLNIKGVANLELDEYEDISVTFNGATVNSSAVINHIRRVAPETEANLKESTQSEAGKMQISTGSRTRWVTQPVAGLSTYVGRKVRITSVAGEVKTGRLSKVKNARYSVIQKIGSGEYGSYEVVENIKRLEVWDDK